MAISDANQLVDVLEQLVAATEIGKVQWTKINPTTYSWPSDSGKVVIQKVPLPRGATGSIWRAVTSSQSDVSDARTEIATRYMLEVFDAAGEPQLVASSVRSRDVQAALESAYAAISSQFAQKGVDFLRELVEMKAK
jgi:hypothetical protein